MIQIRNLKKIILSISLILFISGCSTSMLNVKDIDENNISGVIFKTENKKNTKVVSEEISGSGGSKNTITEETLEKYENISDDNGNINLTGIYFNYGILSKDGYISQFVDGENRKTEYKLYKINNYFSNSFLADDRYVDLRNKIAKFVVEIGNTAYYKSAILKLHKIDLYEFKENNYIEIFFDKETINYGDKYQIGKNLYSELVVKILDYLVLIEDQNVNGAKVSIIGYSANKTPILFDFIMNKDTIRKYKDKDITSQKLLDESVILMDNERIELKLQ